MSPFFKILIAASLALPVTGIASASQPAQNQDEPLDQPQIENPIIAPENNDVIDTGDNIDRLFEKLRRDIKPKSASATARMIWREWSYSGSKSIDLLMSWAARAMRTNNNAKALDLLDQVVTLAPEYAEGWNRRATLYYTMSNYSSSLSDIERTLALEPRHFGALSGLAAILQRFNKPDEALETWYKVLEIYPANENAQKAVINLEEKLSGSPT